MQKVTIGIVGGIGPESTIDYYRRIISSYRSQFNSDANPEILINSIDMVHMLKLVQQKNWPELVELLTHAVEALRMGGADLAVIASNTPHVVFDAVKSRAAIPMISIVEQTCSEALKIGSQKTLLLGTSFTMQSDFYHEKLNKNGIHCVVPDTVEQNIIQNIIFPDLENGIVKLEKKKELIAIVNKYIAKEEVDSVILGCTELPLMIKKEDLSIKVLNTTEIHVKSILAFIGECRDEEAALLNYPGNPNSDPTAE